MVAEDVVGDIIVTRHYQADNEKCESHEWTVDC